MFIYNSCKVSGLTYSCLHQRLLKSFNEAANSKTTFWGINMGRNSIFRALNNSNANSRGKYDIKLTSNYLPCRGI